jgi:hypothetical protein
MFDKGSLEAAKIDTADVITTQSLKSQYMSYNLFQEFYGK